MALYIIFTVISINLKIKMFKPLVIIVYIIVSIACELYAQQTIPLSDTTTGNDYFWLTGEHCGMFLGKNTIIQFVEEKEGFSAKISSLDLPLTEEKCNVYFSNIDEENYISFGNENIGYFNAKFSWFVLEDSIEIELINPEYLHLKENTNTEERFRNFVWWNQRDFGFFLPEIKLGNCNKIKANYIEKIINGTWIGEDSLAVEQDSKAYFTNDIFFFNKNNIGIHTFKVNYTTTSNITAIGNLTAEIMIDVYRDFEWSINKKNEIIIKYINVKVNDYSFNLSELDKSTSDLLGRNILNVVLQEYKDKKVQEVFNFRKENENVIELNGRIFKRF